MTDRKKTVGPTTKGKTSKAGETVPCEHYKDRSTCPECSKPTATETPASNADKGVDNKIDIEYRDRLALFSESMPGLLPALIIKNRRGIEIEIGPIADVMFASGYFGDLTPAQIAVYILVGRSLGLDDAQSVFDLTIEPGPIVFYKPRRSYEETADAIQAEKAGLKTAVNKADRIAPNRALHADNAEKGVAAGSNVAEFPNSANKSPSPIPIDEGGEDSVPASETTSAAGLHASAAANEIDPFSEPAQEPEPDPLLPVPGSIGDPSRSAEIADAAASIGDVSAETVAAWREGFVIICGELSLPADKITKYDAEPLPGKKKMFDDAQVYYQKKTDDVRAGVLTALQNDGKSTIDAMQGYFAFAEVGSDPLAWSYSEAVKAAVKLSDFLTSPAA